MHTIAEIWNKIVKSHLYELGTGVASINTVSSFTLEGFLGAHVLAFSPRKTAAKLSIPTDC